MPKPAPALAEALYRENPGDLSAALTYGLALYQQGRPEEAAAVVGEFGPEALRAPRAALYYGVYLAAAGRAEEASEYPRARGRGAAIAGGNRDGRISSPRLPGARPG